jgi:hypothetical protein
MRIGLSYTARQPAASHAEAGEVPIALGQVVDARSSRDRLGADIAPAEGSPRLTTLVEQILREGLATAGWQVAESAPLRLEARVVRAWAEHSFYRAQAHLQVVVRLVDGARGADRWSHRFGIVEGAGGTDVRRNYEAAYKNALTKLAADVADAFASETFTSATTR